MGSIERGALPPIGTKGVSISHEDARRFAVDLLDSYLFGPDSYYLPEGSWKQPYSPHKTVLNGIYDPDNPTRSGTLVEKLLDLQSRVVAPDSWAYMRSLIDDMKKFREKFEKQLDFEHEQRPFLNSPEILPDEQRNFDLNMEIPDYQGRSPSKMIEPLQLRPRPY